jgi:hypothetical protein
VSYLRDIEKLIRLSIPVSDRRNDQRRAEPPPAKHTTTQPADDKRRWHRGDQARKQSRSNQSNDAPRDMDSVRFMHGKKRPGRNRPPRAALGRSFTGHMTAKGT